MDPQLPTTSQKKPQPVGFAYWMERVLEECARAEQGFAADPVHDLRVSLRRCRSLADGLMAIDPDPAWKQMKRAGRQLFRSLGELRDVQVMKEWVEDLGPAEDAETKALLDLLETREREQKLRAAAALKAFDAKQWRKWAKELPGRAGRVRKGSLIFRHLALERWVLAYELHQRAMRNRSQVALHALRIGIKRFRYIVENFLPHEHAAWGKDLKELQDILGEVHDLDVLWGTAVEVNAFPNPDSRKEWRKRITEERQKRVNRYRELMLGPGSLWRVWRAQLPQGIDVEKAALARMKLWASFLDPEVRHSRHVADLAAQILEELERMGVAHPPARDRWAPILEAAALMHEVGLAKGERGHHKASSRLIRRMPPPFGWTEEGLAMAATVARFHRGALPSARHKALRGMSLDQRRLAVLLSGILRLANALDFERDSRIHRLRMEERGGTLLLWAQGFQPMTRTAEAIAAARYTLEVLLRRPILVRTWRVHVVRHALRAVPA